MRPDPPSSLGNPVPPFRHTLDLAERPPRRDGRVVAIDAGGPPPVDLGALKKILVVKLDFIGDFVLTTPFLAGLRRAAPEAAITVAVLDRVHELASACRFADRVISVAPADRGPVRFSAASERDLDGFLADYRSGAFDLAVVPRFDTDFNGALRLAGGSNAAAVIGFSEGCTDRKAADNRGDDAFYSTAYLDRSEVHEVEHNLALLRALGGDIADRAVTVDMTADDHAAAERFIAVHLGPPSLPLLAVAPFAAGRKLYPPERTAALARRLAARFGLSVAVIGSPEHQMAAAAFARAVGPGAVAAAGRLGLREAAALIARSAALLGMDSSPGHIAAAVGTPAAILFANAAGASAAHVGAPARFAPWGDPSAIRLFQPARALHPCADGCDADTPHCITAIDQEAVYAELEAFVGAALARAGSPAVMPVRTGRRAAP
jgi:heptosyltransferase-2